MDLISRSDAIALGSPRYFTGCPCKRGHIVERRVSDWKCVACHRERVGASLKTPSGRARMAKYDAARNSKPERKAALRRGEKKPERKAKKALYSAEYYAEYMRRPGIKERSNKSKMEWMNSGSDTALNYKIGVRLRVRLLDAVRGKYRSGLAIQALGCSIPDLQDHLKSLFQDGMSWENYGEWHIDHIRPLSSFDLSDKEQVKSACHFTNLQPLWAKDNISKGAKSVENWQRSNAA